MESKDHVFSKAVDAGGRIRVRSALNPILWLCAIVSIPVLAAGAFLPVPTWVATAGCAPIAAAVFGFMYLLLTDPDKLQSEDYQLKKRTMELAQQKGQIQPTLINDYITTNNHETKKIAATPELHELGVTAAPKIASKLERSEQ
ncbi:hypothetical protein D3C77_529340 [compost metagenome]